MIQFPANANVIVMHEPISFRSGFEGTMAIARVVLQREPLDGAFFVFRNKLGHMLRVLCYDGSGMWLCTKRLSTGTFVKVWPKGDGTSPSSPLLARELQILVWGGDPKSCAFPQLWRRIA